MTTNTPRVGAVIVTYKNTSNVLDLVGDLIGQSVPPHQIFIIDNGANEEGFSAIRYKFPNVHYVMMSENTGSAGGYREGLRLASIDNDYVFTLDDDLRLVPDAIKKLIAGFAATHTYSEDTHTNVRAAVVTGNESRFPEDELALTGKPNNDDLTYSFAELKQRIGFAWRGKLISCEAIKLSGLPRSDYFIYGEDSEYSLRLAAFGFTYYAIPDVVFFDNRNPNKSSYSLFLTSTFAYNDDFRLYYSFRNELNIMLEYKQFIGIAKLVGHAIKSVIGIMLKPQNPQGNAIKAITRGLWDGFGSQLGKNIEFLPDNK